MRRSVNASAASLTAHHMGSAAAAHRRGSKLTSPATESSAHWLKPSPLDMRNRISLISKAAPTTMPSASAEATSGWSRPLVRMEGERPSGRQSANHGT